MASNEMTSQRSRRKAWGKNGRAAQEIRGETARGTEKLVSQSKGKSSGSLSFLEIEDTRQSKSSSQNISVE